ncbi:MAG: CBS domain-containing protein [Promethearchaeota archaeon]
MTKIIELARKRLIDADINSNFRDIARIMLNNNVGSVIIRENGKIIGFIDDKSILNLIKDGINPIEEKIKDYIKKFPEIEYNLDVVEAWEKIKNRQEERWGLVKEGSVIGIVRKRTISDFYTRILKEELHIEDETF